LRHSKKQKKQQHLRKEKKQGESVCVLKDYVSPKTGAKKKKKKGRGAFQTRHAARPGGGKNLQLPTPGQHFFRPYHDFGGGRGGERRGVKEGGTPSVFLTISVDREEIRTEILDERKRQHRIAPAYHHNGSHRGKRGEGKDQR